MSKKHSVSKNPNKKSKEIVKIHGGYIKRFFWPQILKSVLKVTYLTWLQRCTKSNQSKVSEAKTKIEICKISWKLKILFCNLKDCSSPSQGLGRDAGEVLLQVQSNERKTLKEKNKNNSKIILFIIRIK